MASLCRHVRKGVVTNQTGTFDPKKPHAAAQVCHRPDCIVTVGRWVSGVTGMVAYYRSDADPDRTHWVPVDEVGG
jgi:hypothetical protein